MAEDPRDEVFRAHAEFLAQFLAQGAPRDWLLRAPAGTGKSFVITRAIKAVFEREPSARVLMIVTHRAMAAQISHRAAEEVPGLEVQVVDRRRFLALESQAGAGHDPWRTGTFSVVLANSARRSEVQDSILASSWSLLVADDLMLEPDSVSRQLLDELRWSGKFERTLISTRERDLEIEGLNSWDFAWEAMFGTTPFVGPDAIDFERTAEECEVIRKIETAAVLLDEIGLEVLPPSSLRSAKGTSPLAAENTVRGVLEKLRHLRNRMAHGLPLELPHDADSEDEAPVAPQPSAGEATQFAKLPAAILALEELADALSEVDVDSKLSALERAATEWREADPQARIWVVTSYQATAAYVAAGLDDLGPRVFVLSGATDPAETSRKLFEFADAGGVLVSTDMILQGLDLRRVDVCVHYDVPRSPKRIEFRHSRLYRVSPEPTKVYVLRDTSGCLQSEGEAVAQLLSPEQPASSARSARTWSRGS